jgi:hypothetical protein
MIINQMPWQLTATAGVIGLTILTLITVSTYRTIKRLTRTVDAQMALTVAIAGIATGVSADGMWRVFGDVLHMNRAERIGGFAFLELAIMVEALRARANLRDPDIRSVGVDGVAVWVLAASSGALSAMHQPGAVGKALRLGAPLVAAWLWERGLAPERRKGRGVRQQVAWRFTRQRVAVWLRLADPAERATTDVDRARRLARLTRSRLHVAVLETATTPRWVARLTARPARLAVARWRLTRQSLAAVEHMALGQDAKAVEAIRATVAAVVGLPHATDPMTLATATPWDAPSVARRPRHPRAITAPPGGVTATETGATDATATTPLTQDATPVDRATGPVAAVSFGAVADMTKADQVAWFARQIPRHPGRTVAEWVAETGLAKRTVDRRLADARATKIQTDDPASLRA